MTRKKKNDLSGEALKNMLWDTMNNLKGGNIQAKDANAIASQSREICRVAKLELEVLKLQGNPAKSDYKGLLK